MNQTILIDSDILVYKVACSLETPIYIVKNGAYIRKGYAEKISRETGFAIHKRVNIGSVQELSTRLHKAFKTIKEDLGSNEYKSYITASKVKDNFRSSLATILPYKGNRAKSSKPYHYRNIRKLLVDEHKSVLVNGQEADDQIAIEQSYLRNKYGNWERSVIATIDKDLDAVPGHHYNLNHRCLYFIEPDKALKIFYRQLLYGDATDNIPGLTKLLKVHDRVEESESLSRTKYLKKYDELTLEYEPEKCFEHVLRMYEGYGYGEKELGEIWNLLWLRRYPGQNGWEDKKRGLIK